MTDTRTFVLFCEDIRREVNDQYTAVGILPDSIALTKIPGTMPKLSILARVDAPLDREISSISHRFVAPSSKEILGVEVAKSVIDDARTTAMRVGSPTYGLITQQVMASFQFLEVGIYRLLTTIDSGEPKMAGFLNVSLAPPAD